jgi:hypothetical protein
MRKLPSIAFREPCSVSKSGEREGWFWRAEKMESDLESIGTCFVGLFPKFCDKELYMESPGDALRIPRKTTP